MAVYKIFPEKDTTVYSEFPNLNTGLDSILEIKNTAPPSTSSPQVARTLIQFPSDKMAEVAGIIFNTNTIPVVGPVPPSTPTGMYSASLKLFVADSYNLPDNYTLYCYATSQSWQAGTGRYLYDPAYTQDSNWVNRNNSNEWLTSSFFTNTTASFDFNNPGGGTWWTNYVGSQSFVINTTKDTNINVTDIVETFNTPGFLENNGFILKYSNSNESDTQDYGILKFFSKETNTIYQPKIRIGWDDQSFVTGSLIPLVAEDIKVGVTNLKSEIKVGTTPKIRIFGRELYPVKTFTNSFAYNASKYLPTTSYYQIKDAQSDDIIIPFSNFSKISCDSNGNYINLNLSNWEADRTYKIEFKVTIDGNTQYFDNNITFRIVKN